MYSHVGNGRIIMNGRVWKDVIIVCCRELYRRLSGKPRNTVVMICAPLSEFRNRTSRRQRIVNLYLYIVTYFSSRTHLTPSVKKHTGFPLIPNKSHIFSGAIFHSPSESINDRGMLRWRGKFQTEIISWHQDLKRERRNRKGGEKQESYKLVDLNAMFDTCLSILLSKCWTDYQSGQMKCFSTVKYCIRLQHEDIRKEIKLLLVRHKWIYTDKSG
jgi:hypothetical protein